MMEQRYTRKSDIRPIEELISKSIGKKTQTTHPEAYQHNARPEQFKPAFPASGEMRQQESGLRPKRVPFQGGSNAARQHAAFEEEQPKRSRSLMWGVIGFIMGVTFWHFVGFWDLVDKALFKEPEHSFLNQTIKETAESKKSQDALPITTAVATEKAPEACITLVMDRKRNETFSKPCEPGVKLTYKHSEMQTAARSDQ